MGNLCGKPSAEEDEELSPLEEKLVEKLKIRSKDRTNPIKVSRGAPRGGAVGARADVAGARPLSSPDST